jgi:transcription elongation GreA/GreB family factor
MQATAYTYDAETRSGQVLLRPGQRVRIETEGEGDARTITLVTLQTF